MRARDGVPVSAGLRIVVWLALAVMWSAAWDSRPLASPDEGRYAEISREMAASGDFVTPRLNGIKYFEKPPLQYWATAAAFRVGGLNERSARLWTVACGFLSLLVCSWLARLAGCAPAASLLAPVVLAGALYPCLLGHINTLDSGVSLFMGATVACYLRARVETIASDSRREGSARRWMMLAGVCAGLAVLSKGLIGIVLPGLGLVLYTLLSRELSAWRQLHLGSALLAMLIVAAPWFVACSLRNPEFAHFFFIHEHFERFTSTVHRRVEPFWYFLPLLLVGLLPWTLTLPGALLRGFAFRIANGAGFRPLRFLLAYGLGIVAFFSVSGSKLPSYVLPACAPLAVLLAHQLCSATPFPRWSLAAGAAGLGGLLVSASLLFGVPDLAGQLGVNLDLDPDMVGPYAALGPWLGAGGAGLLSGAVLLLVLPESRRIGACLSLGLLGLFAASCGLHGARALAPFNSTGPWVASWAHRPTADSRLFSVGTYDQTLDFYLQRTVTLVDFRDELDFGLQQEPGLAIQDLSRFRATWGQRAGDHAIMEPGRFESLRASGLAMQLVARDSRHVLVSAP